MKGQRISYSQQELDWVRAHADLSRPELHALFVAEFNRPELCVNNLKRLCQRQGWTNSNTGRFPPGNVPHTKGQKGLRIPGSEKGWFRKGARSHNFLGPGHEHIRDDGYVELIIDEVNPWNGHATRPVLKHLHLWQQQHGALPEGMCLKCLDGNRTNTDLTNWEMVPRGLLPRLNGKSGRSYDIAPAELKPLIMATAKLEHRAAARKKAVPHD